MNENYKILASEQMCAAGISGGYETLAGSGKDLMKKYNKDDNEKPVKTDEKGKVIEGK